MNKIINSTMLEKTSRNMTPEHRITIQQLDEWHEIDSTTELLPPEVITEDLVIEDSPVTNDEYHLDSSPKSSLVPILSKNDEKIQRDEGMIFWLPRDVCLVKFICHSRATNFFLIKKLNFN